MKRPSTIPVIMQTPRRDFHHPYEPYQIQSDLMNAVYDCIDSGKIGIFESPTGPTDRLEMRLESLTNDTL